MMARRIPEQIAAEVAQARQELSKIVPVELTFVESVIVGERLRQIDPAVVDTLAQSIAEIGLQVPITVRLEECPDGQRVHLVAGAHRLAAVRRLGWEQVPAAFTEADATDVRRWEIAENLHRAELTALERAEHVREWVRLTEQKNIGASCADIPRTRGQPKGGINAPSATWALNAPKHSAPSRLRRD
ncbi:MAG: ParB N-terminal domain-containing protein [Blastochloris sp.]|nr:ParB N-terminal domain-containing protein [Blastochloris sp.]